MRVLPFLLVLLVAACGTTSGQRPRSAREAGTAGAITGLVRDKKSVDPLTNAEVEIAGHKATSDKAGIYLVDNLAPGLYTLRATYAGQTMTIKNIDVTRGMATYVDVSFPLGEPGELIDWGNSRENEVVHFTATSGSRIEGTVNDSNTRGRVAGAVITAARGPEDETLQTVSDDDGRYRFDTVVPATYTISAYYSIAGRGQVEVRRSDVVVKSGEGVLVPLWIELAK